ncbi:MAG: DUF1501 domain-containing protein [Verrucomicrobiaceae bacterium]|nr:DUF1501 domain-containing protein [Verrucomicrobiaceae bacterium]
MNTIQPTPFLRRDILGGLGGIAAASLLSANEDEWQQPSGLPMLRQKAKRVIWLFMRGGVSHMESFDPKPALNIYAGKTIGETPYKEVQDPEKLKKVRVVVVNDANGQQRNTIYPLQVGYRRYGQCGIDISDWFPNIGSCADEIAFVRSMWTTDDNHGAQVQFHSGRHMLEPRVPTLGAWITYGLGSMTDNLPSFVNIGPRYFDVRDGHYLGPAYDAVNLKVDPKNPLTFARPEMPVEAGLQRAQFDLIHRLNALSADEYPGDKVLAARMKSYQLAFNMQVAVPETLGLDAESEATKKLYGMDQKVTEPFGRQLLVARRLAERGVRFIQLQHGDGAAGAWDSHSGLKKNHSSLAQQVDKPISGLLKDLKQRGLLDDTLVVFATEFGRTPGSQGSDGRDHHPYGFSVWMAGGGVKGGTIHGSTDELGFHAVDSPHYVTDVHATILHLLGLNPRKLEIPGRKRLERDFGNVIHPILA